MTCYKFIEIGTADFHTEIQKASDKDFGISIEPSLSLLNKLPNRKNIIKINAAVTHKRSSETVFLYHVPKTKENINIFQSLYTDKRGVRNLFGCNSINRPHSRFDSKPDELKLVEKTEVPLVNLREIWEEHEVEKVGLLKIDTEGHDCTIMRALYEYLLENNIGYPNRIIFETNCNSNLSEVDEIIALFDSIGYSLVSRGHDAELKRLVKLM